MVKEAKFHYVADLDISYRPKKEGRLRFVVRDRGLDDTQFILDEVLMSGGGPLPGTKARGGYLRLQGYTGGYYYSNYICAAH